MHPLVTHRRRIWLYAAAAIVLVFLALPVLVVVPMSFSDSRMLDFPPRGWSLRWYARFFSALEWHGALLLSLKLAAATVIVATPVGVAAAYGIHSVAQRLGRRLQLFLLLPLMVPHIVLAIGIFYVFVRLELVGTFIGLLAAHAMLALPFVVVAVLAGLRSFDMNQEMVARSLGCTRWRAFMTVTLPQIRPSVLSGALFAFVTSLDEVVVSLFIGGGDNTTITKVMFGSLRDEIDPTVATVSAILIVVSLGVMGLAGVLVRTSALSARGRIPADA